MFRHSARLTASRAHHFYASISASPKYPRAMPFHQHQPGLSWSWPCKTAHEQYNAGDLVIRRNRRSGPPASDVIPRKKEIPDEAHERSISAVSSSSAGRGKRDHAVGSVVPHKAGVAGGSLERGAADCFLFRLCGSCGIQEPENPCPACPY